MIRFTSLASRLAIAMVLAVLLAWALPAAVFAAPGAPLERVELQLDPGTAGGSAMLIITGVLPESTPMPATIRLAIPQGMTLNWVGEVLGGALEDDLALDPAIEHGENGYDIATLTLTQGGRGQVELDATGVVVQHGDLRTIRVAWMPVDVVGTIGLMTAAPMGATIDTMTPGATTGGGGPGNSTLISLDTTATQGVEAVLDVAYSVQAVPAGATTGSQGSNAPLIIIFGTLAALFVLAGVAIAKKTRPTEAADHEVSDEDDTPDDEPAQEPAAVGSDDDGESESLAPEDTTPPRRAISPKIIILVAVAVILGGTVLTMITGEAPGTTRTTDEFAYKVLTDAKADESVTLGIPLSEGDPAHESVHVFEALAGVPGVRSVKLVFATSTVEIEYASSTVDAGTIQGALAAGGYPSTGTR